MYGLPHVGIISQKLLKEQLENHGYRQSDKTPVFWKHNTRPISFTLIDYDLGVKYVGKKHVNHLINVMKKHYTVAEDWEGENYGGITLGWYYTKRKVNLSMPEYVKDYLIQFQHTLRKLTNQPHKHIIPAFGAAIQYENAADTSNKLDDNGKSLYNKSPVLSSIMLKRWTQQFWQPLEQ